MFRLNRLPARQSPSAPVAGAASPRSVAALSILVAVRFLFIVIEAWSRHTAWQSELAQSAVAAENVASAAEEHTTTR